MDLFEAKVLANNLLYLHGLSLQWSFEFNKRKTHYGLCNESTKTIFLSSILTKQCSYDQVKDTILHEIAHALVGCRNGHNEVWKSKAIEIGCNGERCARYNHHRTVDAKYITECKNCGKTYKLHRKPKLKRWCKCTSHGFKEENRLIYVQQF